MSYVSSPTAHPVGSRTGSVLPFLGAALTLCVLGLLTTTPALSGWFTQGPRSDWTLQTWVFSAVWTVLYLADGAAGWLIRRQADAHLHARATLAYFWAQVVLQAVWLIGFLAQTLTGGDLLWLVFVAILLLDIATGLAAASAWSVSRPASLILLLVLAWLLFGTVLSGVDTILRGGFL